MASLGSSFWCYRCNRIVRVPTVSQQQQQHALLCPDCGSGFVEEIRNPSHSHFHRFPGGSHSDRRSWRSGGGGDDRSPFNPVIVLRGGGNDGGAVAERGNNNFELYYDDGGGSGLRPLPASVTEFLMGSGFDHLLDQLAPLEGTAAAAAGIGTLDQPPPASKDAIESMPVVKIVANHVRAESHCAVCMEPFEIDSDAREMPCKHIYHSDCILPWLSVRNSCPVCRREMAAEPGGDGDAVGLTIWRLPGGGFAVGRFVGGRRGAEREVPVVYTEMDGGFNGVGVGVVGGGGGGGGGAPPRRVSWDSSVGRSRERRGLGGAFRNLFSYFGRVRTSFSRSNSSNRSSTVLSRFSVRQS